MALEISVTLPVRIGIQIYVIIAYRLPTQNMNLNLDPNLGLDFKSVYLAEKDWI